MADPRVFLEFHVSRVETDLAQAFLRGSVTLGGAAARAETDLSVTGGRSSVTQLVTERDALMRVPLDVLHRSSDEPRVYYQRYVAEDEATHGEHVRSPVVQVSARARLNITASRTAAAINGAIVSTMSGQGSVLLRDLLPVRDPSDQHEHAKPFVQVPVKYAGWADHSAVFGIHGARVVTVRPTESGADGTTTEDVVILYDHAHAKRMAMSEPILKSIYDSSWELREKLVYPKSPFLHKSVARVPVGENGSSFELAALINDAPSTFNDMQIESILQACVGLEFQFDEAADKPYKDMLGRLADGPCFEATREYSERLATAVSTFQSFAKPYRVDGTPVVLPSGTKMVSAESWLMEPARSIFAADDCDGSACSAISVVQACVDLRDRHAHRVALHDQIAARASVAAASRRVARLGGAAALPTEAAGAEEEPLPDVEALSPRRFPHMHAVANSLGSHFVYGVSVLGANAGHADAADTEAESVAGHAVAVLIPKTQFMSALKSSAQCYLPTGDVVVAADVRKEVERARFEALYPASLHSLMTKETDRKAFASWDALQMSEPHFGCSSSSLQFLAMEGTTPACARTYEHNRSQREERVAKAKLDKQVGAKLSPNISRSFKSLDSVQDTEGHEHGFYDAFVEFSVSIGSGLFTHPKLRELGHASPHYVLTQSYRRDEIMEEAGATPAQLATGNYGIVPLWRVETESASVLDDSAREALDNLVPARNVAHPLSERESSNLAFSVSVLKMLRDTFEGASSDDGRGRHTVQQVFSFAAMVRNPQAVAAFSRVVRAIPGVTGCVDLKTVAHIARYPSEQVKVQSEQRQQCIFDIDADPSCALIGDPLDTSGAPLSDAALDTAGRFCVVNLSIPL